MAYDTGVAGTGLMLLCSRNSSTVTTSSIGHRFIDYVPEIGNSVRV